MVNGIERCELLQLARLISAEHPNLDKNTDMLNLPTELLVYIVSFLPSLRDRVTLLYVSRRLRSVVSESPLLWRDFVWNTGDEGSVNKVLKMCGQHVKRLSFPHYVTPSKLVGMSEYCKNVIQLGLPSTKLHPEQLGRILLHMEHLQRLDIQWDTEVKQLLDEVVGMNLTELTIRLWVESYDAFYHNNKLRQSLSLFLDDWILLGFVPQNVNLFTAMMTPLNGWQKLLLDIWYKAKSTSPVGCTGYFKWYVNHKIPLNLFPMLLPVFQLEFGQTTFLPFVSTSNCGLPELENDLLRLTNCVSDSNLVYQVTNAFMEYEQWIKFSSFFCSSRNLGCAIIQLFLQGCDLSSNQLGQIGTAFPNLQRLDISNNEDCLERLQGLCTIASSCHHLQGLNLLGVPLYNLENQLKLWEILSDMKLTHLAIDLSLLLPSSEDAKQKMISLFKKYASLRALESEFIFYNSYKGNLKPTILSHFSSLIFYRTDSCFVTTLQDLLTSCKGLTCLSVCSRQIVVLRSLTLISHCNLLQLSISSGATDLPNNFMNMVSAHGRLEHVVLYVNSVTSEGIAMLVSNSPNLVTFHLIVKNEICQHTGAHERVNSNVLDMRLKQEYSHHRLFLLGSFIVKVANYGTVNLNKLNLLFDHLGNTDLISMW